jgi:integrase-like protein
MVRSQVGVLFWRGSTGPVSVGTTLTPAKPQQNAILESLIGRVRDELLNAEISANLAQARLLAAGARPGLVDGAAVHPVRSGSRGAEAFR